MKDLLLLGSGFRASDLHSLASILSDQSQEDKKLTMTEGCKEYINYTVRNLVALSKTQWTMLEGDALDGIRSRPFQEGGLYDFVFIDALHDKEFNLKIFLLLLPKLTTYSLVIFDDIHFTEPMYEMWNEVCRHPRVLFARDFIKYPDTKNLNRFGLLLLDWEKVVVATVFWDKYFQWNPVFSRPQKQTSYYGNKRKTYLVRKRSVEKRHGIPAGKNNKDISARSLQ